jgi:hypothetical protein
VRLASPLVEKMECVWKPCASGVIKDDKWMLAVVELHYWLWMELLVTSKENFSPTHKII